MLMYDTSKSLFGIVGAFLSALLIAFKFHGAVCTGIPITNFSHMFSSFSTSTSTSLEKAMAGPTLFFIFTRLNLFIICFNIWSIFGGNHCQVWGKSLIVMQHSLSPSLKRGENGKVCEV